MGNHKHLLLTIALVALAQFPANVRGQEKAKTGKTQAASPRAVGVSVPESLARARQLAADAQGLETAEERARFLIRLSDITWEWDGGFARGVAGQSFNAIASAVGDAAEAGEARGSEAQDNRALLLRQIAATIARHDPQFARQLTDGLKTARAERADAGGAPPGRAGGEQEANSLLAESARALNQDKARAQALFVQSASIRVLPAHCFFLLNLRKQDPALADRWLAGALGALAGRGLAEANEVLVLASYLFSRDESVGYNLIGGYNAANVMANLSAAPKNQALARQYLAVVAKQLTPGAAIPATVVYLGFKNLLPQYTALAPEMLDEVYGRMSALESSVAQDERDEYESAHAAHAATPDDEARTWDERLRKADKIDDPNFRDLEYYTAVTGHLIPKKDFADALLIAGKISNPVLAGRLSDYLRLLTLQENGARRGGPPPDFDYPAAYKPINDPLLKTVALCESARALIGRKDITGANDLLARAASESEHVADAQDRLQTRLLIAQLYLTVDPPRGFEAANAAFREINKAERFNMWRSGFTITLSVYGLTNRLSLNTPFPASLMATVEKMCAADCAEAFVSAASLADRSRRLWASLRAVDLSLAKAKTLSEGRK